MPDPTCPACGVPWSAHLGCEALCRELQQIRQRFRHEALNPDEGFIDCTVDVRLACGRYYLNVFGVVVAMEGDVCRWFNVKNSQWDKAGLEEAALQIRRRIVDIAKGTP